MWNVRVSPDGTYMSTGAGETCMRKFSSTVLSRRTLNRPMGRRRKVKSAESMPQGGGMNGVTRLRSTTSDTPCSSQKACANPGTSESKGTSRSWSPSRRTFTTAPFASSGDRRKMVS